MPAPMYIRKDADSQTPTQTVAAPSVVGHRVITARLRRKNCGRAQLADIAQASARMMEARIIEEDKDK